MIDAELLFSQSPALDGALVFGLTEDIPNTTATLVATLPGPTLLAFVGPPVVLPVTLAAALPGPTLTVAARYDTNVPRPVVALAASAAQTAQRAPVGVADTSARPVALRSTSAVLHTPADPVRASLAPSAQSAAPVRASRVVSQDRGIARRAAWQSSAQSSVRLSRASVSSAQSAQRLPAARALAPHQVGDPSRRVRLVSPHALAERLQRGAQGRNTEALARQFGAASNDTRAMRPAPGVWTPTVVVPPQPDPCYLPDPVLLFSAGAGGDGRLVFWCERHPDAGVPPPGLVVIPTQRVYTVLNDITLRRVAGNLPIPAPSLSLSIDVDSWTWGFSASIPPQFLDAVQPDGSGQPVELEATINGHAYRVLVEDVSSERQFGSHSVRINGRGKSALLSGPYAPVQSFTNTVDRTAAQLMADVLTLNGTPIGWTVDWGIEDWLVPAGAFVAQGTYIDALTSIVGAAGGYLQPHATDQTLRAMLRYPTASWAWGGVTPDFELPADLTTRESIAWASRPAYNRVFVSGAGQGVLGQVTRSGSGGNLVAPMVTDALITSEVPARLRGVRELSEGGRSATVGLRLPVLPATGIIAPGKFVRYADGATSRMGIVRATNVEAGFGEVWQSLTVETRA